MEPRSQNHQKLGSLMFWMDPAPPRADEAVLTLDDTAKSKINGIIYALVYRLPRL